MRRGGKFLYALGGFALGVLAAAAVWYWAGKNEPGAVFQSTPPGGAAALSGGQTGESAPPQESGTASDGAASAPRGSPAGEWDSAAVYVGGDTVSHGGRLYRAKWWTQGETPGGSDVWEALGIVDGEPAQPQGVDNVPIDASVPRNTELTGFR